MLCTGKMQAQWEASFSRFWTAKSYYNPSFAGETENIRVVGLYRHQWTGLENAPKQVYLSGDMPIMFFGKKHGIGVTTYANSMSDQRNSIFAAQYAFKQKLGKGVFSIGVQAGLHEMNFDEASIHLINDTTANGKKQIKAAPTEKKAFNLNAGISWTSKRFFIGIGAMNLNTPSYYAVGNSIGTSSLNTDSTRSIIPTSYNLIAGGNIPLFHPLFEVQPMLFGSIGSARTCFSTALQLMYNKKYSLGAAWRGKEGYSFFAGVVIQDIEFGYAYDLHKSGIGAESGGSHEISVRYSFPVQLFGRESHPRKSIRLL